MLSSCLFTLVSPSGWVHVGAGLVLSAVRSSCAAPENAAADVADSVELATLRQAQVGWARAGLRARLQVIRAVRRRIAMEALPLAGLLAERRPAAETLAAEVLPLLEAARFLERAAPGLLAPRRLGMRGRPVWLAGVSAEVRRDPAGVVLVLAPSNYPLLLPGVQILQALAAGNAVAAKPAPGCVAVMERFAEMLRVAGLPDGVLRLLAPEAGPVAVRAGFDRILLTGSAATGQAVLQAAAETLTPCTMELSGNDAAFVLPGADLSLVAAGLAYGMRLNGGATCIAPRRVFVPRGQAVGLEQALMAHLASVPAASVPAARRALVAELVDEAEAAGARVSAPTGDWAAAVPPVVVADAGCDLRLMREDVFAPVICLVPVGDMTEALEIARLCPYALGATVWGPEAEARALAREVPAGSVVVNDLIVPTADPRVPFGGRARSGFGVTRGAEGLLELTATRVISVRRGRFRPHFRPPRAQDQAFFMAIIALLHGGVRGILRLLRRGVSG
jgi:acyl-CoA reductase-like NAD-dependent aldehyde dehydrogenase